MKTEEKAPFPSSDLQQRRSDEEKAMIQGNVALNIKITQPSTDADPFNSRHT